MTRLSGLAGKLARPWVALFVVTRVTATVVAVTLLLAHVGGNHDDVLAVVILTYGIGTIPLALARRLRESPLAWAIDVAATLALILVTDTWRTPCYLLFLSALVLPSTSLTLRPALAFGALATGGYVAVAAISGIDIPEVKDTPRLESFVTHVFVPLLMVLALAYASDLMRRLRGEHARAERLAIEAERQRIGWELHDSAKQRTQVAHLLLSSLGSGFRGDAAHEVVQQAMAELRQASLDMEASVATEQPPILSGDALGPALRIRASELAAAGRRAIEVHGDAARCPPMVAAHVYRIGGEALANAVRHANAANIVAELDETADRLMLTVRDDGLGMPARLRPGASGLQSMKNRAQSIGAVLTITPVRPGPQPGTQVTLEVPLNTRSEEEP